MSRGVFTSREVSLKFSYSFRDRVAILRLRGRGGGMILADDYRMHCKRTITPIYNGQIERYSALPKITVASLN
jgi:hypothetical protein